METWGGCIGAVSPSSASNRHGYTAAVLRLRAVSDVPRQLACGSPLSAVQRVGKLLSGLNNEQLTTTAARQPRPPRPPACCSLAAQPRDSPRVRCGYTFPVLHHTSSGLAWGNAMRRRLLELRSKNSKTKVRLVDSLPNHALTCGQAPAELSTSSASSASAESTATVATVAQGLQLVAEGTNPTVEYVSGCLFAQSQLT
jgi:hypothetical protein